MRTLFLSTVLLIGCPADPVDRIPDETGDTAGGETTDTDPLPIPWGNRILLYYGHGAPDADDSGFARFDGLEHHWESTYDWNVDYRSYIPDELSDHRAIFFIAPGYTGEASFDPAELERLRGALEIGVRIIVLTDKDGCATATPSELLEGLGSTMRFGGDGLSTYQVAEIDLISPHQSTTGVSSLHFRDPCYVDVGDGDYLARYNDEYMVGVERIGDGGEVMLIGDVEFMDDSGPIAWGDNGTFADRLIEIDPAMAE